MFNVAMAHVTEHAFQCDDPVWVWTFGAYYPGVVESIAADSGFAMIRWPAEAENVQALRQPPR